MKWVQNERELSQAERILAYPVFKTAVPLYDVVLTDGLGYSDRPFTLPNPLPFNLGSKILTHFRVMKGRWALHVGQISDMTISDGNKKTLIHELTHVWQGENYNHSWSYILDSAIAQLKGGDDAYEYDTSGSKPMQWMAYNPEQQAMIVEDWYAATLLQGKPEEEDWRFSYIQNNIRAAPSRLYGQPPPPWELPEDTERQIMTLLQQRFPEGDPAALKRVEKLAIIFSTLTPKRAEMLHVRLHKPYYSEGAWRNNKMAQYFEHHLSTITQERLKGILLDVWRQTIRGVGPDGLVDMNEARKKAHHR